MQECVGSDDMSLSSAPATHRGGCQRSHLSRAFFRASQVALVVKNPPATAGDVRDAGSIPGSGRSPGGGHGNPLQYSCLENPMDRGVWQAAAHGIEKSGTQLSNKARITFSTLK